MTRLLGFLLMTCFVVGGVGCGEGSDVITHAGDCDLYTASADSPYVLPFPSGQAYSVSQGNCSSVSHFGPQRYAYDFAMDIGTTVVAARAGRVVDIEESFADGNGCPKDNHVFVEHSDGSVAAYVHLTSQGVLVNVGDSVTQGQTIGRSGNTGCSSSPHLHFVVFKDSGKTESVPVTFKNTTAHSRGLRAGREYRAQ